MNIKVKKPCHIYAIPRKVGEQVDVEPDLGARLIEAGYGTKVSAEPETAEAEEPETADAPAAARGRKRG
jgi:hypothetical protein